MAVVQNERDKTLQATNPRLVATTVVISATGALFTKPDATNPITPSSITLTGTTTVFTSPTITWTYASNSDMVWVSYGTGASKTVTSADFLTHLGASGTKVFYKAVATQFGYTTAESPIFEISYTDLTGGVDGEDAYNIRLDNGTRIVRYDYTGNPVSGQLPVNAQVYVSRGSTDITSGTGYVTYSILSTSGATGASINSTTGAVQVTGITQNTNYVEIQAAIDEPDMPAYNALIKLYITKFVDPSVEIDVDITQDYYYYQYADATSTTNTAAWSTITFLATVAGASGAVVTWDAKTYNTGGTEISGTENIITANGNTATVSAAQFIARGGNAVARLVVTATYQTGGASITDYAVIIRNDGTLGTRYLFSSEYSLTLSGQADGTISAGELASDGVASLQVIDISGASPVDDTTGWSFTATPSAGVTVSINGTGNGPYVAGSPVTIRITDIDFGSLTLGATFSGSVTVVASKATFPSVQTTIFITASLPGTSGTYLSILPDTTILLPTDASGGITGYSGATRTVKVMNGSIDDSSNWTLTRVDGPGVTSTLSGGILSVTNFTSVSDSIVFPTTPDGSFTLNINGYNTSTNLLTNNSGTYTWLRYTTGSNPIKAITSTDDGVTWAEYTLPTPPVSYSVSNSSFPVTAIYAVSLNKFVTFYPTPTTGDNGRVVYSSDGVNWVSAALPNHPTGAYSWHGIFEDTKNGRVYIYDINGTAVIYSDNLTSWTVTTNATATNPCGMSGYDGKFIKARNLSSVGVRYVYYSTNLTSWTDVSSIYGSSEVRGCPDNIENLTIVASAPWSPLTDPTGVKSSTIPNTVWKNLKLDGNTLGSNNNYKLLKKTSEGTIYFSSAGYVFCSSDGLNSARRVVLSPVSTNAVVLAGVGSGIGYNYINSSSLISSSPSTLPKSGGQYVVPVFLLNLSAPYTHTFYRGVISEGNDGVQSYIDITATPNAPNIDGKQPLTARVVVKKAAYTGDIYSLVVNPGTIQLPSTSDGKVYSSAYTNNTNVCTYSVLKNGLPYSGTITGSISASTGITATVSGSGTTGTITVTNMTDAATDGTINGSVSIDGIFGQSLAITVRVVKLRDGTSSGPTMGATVSAFSSSHTSIYVRFNPSGTVEISRGNNTSYVRVADWYYPVTGGTPGSNYYITMHASSDTGDTLQLGTGGTTVGSNTYSQLNISREWYLSNSTPGTHRITLSPRIGTSSTGANAIIGTGTLELQVP